VSSKDLQPRRRQVVPPSAAVVAGGRECLDRAPACRGTGIRRSSSRPSSVAVRSPSATRTGRSRRRVGSDSSVVRNSGHRSPFRSYVLNALLVASRSLSAPGTASTTRTSTVFVMSTVFNYISQTSDHYQCSGKYSSHSSINDSNKLVRQQNVFNCLNISAE